MERLSSLQMWRFDRWRCVYQPFSVTLGQLVVYSKEKAVLALADVPRDDATARATALRILAQLATNRLNL